MLTPLLRVTCSFRSTELYRTLSQPGSWTAESHAGLIIEPTSTECDQSLSRHPRKSLQSVSRDEGRRGAALSRGS